MRLGIVVSATRSAAPTHTTIHLIVAALAGGAQVRVIEADDFEIDERGRVMVAAYALDGVAANAEGVAAVLREASAPRRSIEAESLHALLLRVNPIDTSVLTMAKALVERGVTVLNSPSGLLRTAHKSWLATLPPDVPRPPTLISRSASRAFAFAAGHREGVVLKPARSCGGRGVSWVQADDESAFAQRFAQAAEPGDGLVVAQAYLPEAEQGEKRLLWLDGELVGGYLRQRAEGEFRHNLKLGGIPASCTINVHDQRAIAALGPHLARAGVWFAGIDVIGGQIIEVNVLNPGGAHYTAMFGGVDVGQRLYDSVCGRSIPPSLGR